MSRSDALSRVARKFGGAGVLAMTLLTVCWLWGDVTPAHAQEAVITKTVGTAPGCATTQVITATVGTAVYYCFTIQNTGALSLTEYVYRDTLLSRTFTTTAESVFPPGSVIVRTSADFGSLGPLRLLEPVTNTVVLTATAEGGGIATSQSSARVNLVAPTPLNAAVLITKTVGIVPGVCATGKEVTVNRGEPVYFCFTIANVGNIPFTEYVYEDSYLLQSYTTRGAFWPGSVITRTNLSFSSLGPVTPTRNITNTVSLVADGAYGSAEHFDRARVEVIQPPPEPSILVTKTVGLVGGECATESAIQVSSTTPVYFCISVQNNGNTDFTRITLKDDLLTDPPFSATLAQNKLLEPGQVVTYTNARPELYFLGDIVQSRDFINQVEVTVTGPDAVVQVGGSAASVEILIDPRIYLPTVQR